MKKVIFFLNVLLAFTIISCQQDQQNDIAALNDTFIQDSIYVVQMNKSDNAEYMYLYFKILDSQGKKVFIDKINCGNFSLFEKGNNGPDMTPIVDSVIDIRERKVISDQISMLFLVDRSGSISQNVLDEQYNQIYNLLNLLPNTKMYLSFMDSALTKSFPITKSTIKEYGGEFEVREGTDAYIHKAILAKIEELANVTADHYPEVEHNPALQDSSQKLLFVFTDGKVKNENGHYIDDFFERKGEFIDLAKKQDNNEFPFIPIHCVYIGDPDGVRDIQNEMEALCAVCPSRDALKGKFHTILDVNQLQEVLVGAIDSIAADYKLVLKNPTGKIYDGSEQNLTIILQDNETAKAVGNLRYAFGNQHIPIVVSSDTSTSSNWRTILFGLLYGILFVTLVYITLQYIIPWIQYKIFCKKYIVKYKHNSGASNVEKQHCYHCKEAFQDGDDIDVKCEHVVHLECWKENRNRCPEYGVHNCTKGIHYYNQEKLSDSRNAPYFHLWLVYGLLAGLISWVFMRIIYSETLFAGLIQGITQLFQPETSNNVSSVSFLPKIQALLLCGLILGFFITFFFSCQIEFRKKNLKIWALITLRALVGSLIGFIAFLIGSIIIIFLGKDSNCIYTDWIPWALFAIGIAFTLSFKTDIKLRSALIGGLISVLISFVVLFVTTFAKEILSMFSYMIYAAGFGIAIAIVHHVSEKYFLRVAGPIKERDIAIYKWMSVSGGFNKVTIGKSIDCILEMNWDDADNIADKQVEIYLENDRPYCKALAEGTRLSSGQMLPVNQVILLSHGTEFTIGNSTFTYIEKDK